MFYNNMRHESPDRIHASSLHNSRFFQLYKLKIVNSLTIHSVSNLSNNSCLLFINIFVT